MRQNINFGKLLHGGDYNPEQWLEYPEILEQDLAYFKKAKINEVSLGIFSWAFLEPEEGVFDLEWLKKMVDRLYENGISVMMATPTAARPRWMAQKYPEVLRMDAMRQRNLYGERHNHCYTSPVYREKTRKINTKLAEAFKDHPGVIAWHISNELGGECHCPLCQEAFRNWVKQKYGSLQALNHAWNTAFWSHTYQSFDQVESPSPKGDASLHGLNLDWKRFVTDQTADFVKWEISALRDAGAKEVHFRVSAPPFKYPCYFGTDIPDQKLLVATGRTVDQINEIIGADTLGYLSTEHVVQLAKDASCGFCTACFTGEYAVKPDEVLSTDIHERHLNDRPKGEKKLGE